MKISAIFEPDGKGYSFDQTIENNQPIVDYIVEKFGYDRMIYGSNWFVDTLNVS